MNRFVFLSFLFMGWAFYELSGGADFEPPSARQIAGAEPREETEPEQAMPAIAATGIPATEPMPQPVKTAAPISPASAPALPVITLPETPQPAAPATDAVLSLASIGEAVTSTNPILIKNMRTIRVAQANVRSGPGTDHDILTRISGGTKIEVLQENGAGWVEFRLPESDTTGWVAASLLDAING